MAAFFGRIAALLIPPILNWLYGKAASWVTGCLARRRALAEIKRQNELARKLTESAQTKEERDAATDNLRDRFDS